MIHRAQEVRFDEPEDERDPNDEDGNAQVHGFMAVYDPAVFKHVANDDQCENEKREEYDVSGREHAVLLYKNTASSERQSNITL